MTVDEKPVSVTEEHLTYLDNLRAEGSINMWGATQDLMIDFDLSRDEAKEVLGYWMKTFGERHPA